MATLPLRDLTLADVLSGLHEGVLVISRDFQVLVQNARAAQLLDVPVGEVTAEHFIALGARARGEDGQPLSRDALPVKRCLDTGKPQRHVTFGIEVGTTWRWLRVTAQPLTRPGQAKPYAVVVSMTDVSAGVVHKQALQQAVSRDALTGLLSRVGFEAALERALARRRGGGTCFAVAFLDLDDFKVVNDAFGHAAGDALLRTFAEQLRATLPESDVLARIYGDEFAVLRPAVGDAGGGVQLATAIGAVGRTPFKVEGRELRVTFSVGTQVVCEGHATPGDLLRQTDAHMYQAKRAGKGQSVVGAGG